MVHIEIKEKDEPSSLTLKDKLGDLVQSSKLRTLAYSLIGAGVMVGLFHAGRAIDKSLNPDLVEAATENFKWWRIFTSSHALTAVEDLFPVVTNAVVGLFGAAWGTAAGKVLLDE